MDYRELFQGPPFVDIVRLGAHNLGEGSVEDVDDYVPKQIFIHPQYNDDGSFPQHDIALILLKTESMKMGNLGVGVRQREW